MVWNLKICNLTHGYWLQKLYSFQDISEKLKYDPFHLSNSIYCQNLTNYLGYVYYTQNNVSTCLHTSFHYCVFVFSFSFPFYFQIIHAKKYATREYVRVHKVLVLVISVYNKFSLLCFFVDVLKRVFRCYLHFLLYSKLLFYCHAELNYINQPFQILLPKTIYTKEDFLL